jgi:uncharacterized protein
MKTVEIDTPFGAARVYVESADDARGALVLGHGAGGGVQAKDLVAGGGGGGGARGVEWRRMLSLRRPPPPSRYE